MPQNNKNSYLIKKYNLTVVEYDQIVMAQGGVCRCCGKPAVNQDLHVDHEHRVATTKVRCRAIAGQWVATTELGGEFTHPTDKAAAVLAAKRWLLRKSIRGLLCWKCNMLLLAVRRHAGGRDEEILLSAQKYLADFRAKLVGLPDATGL